MFIRLPYLNPKLIIGTIARTRRVTIQTSENVQTVGNEWHLIIGTIAKTRKATIPMSMSVQTDGNRWYLSRMKINLGWETLFIVRFNKKG